MKDTKESKIANYSWTVKRSQFSNLGQKIIPLHDNVNPPSEMIPTKWVNIKGRKEHEAIIKDAKKCEELGLDQHYEIMVYLKRWGNWLENPSKK